MSVFVVVLSLNIHSRAGRSDLLWPHCSIPDMLLGINSVSILNLCSHFPVFLLSCSSQLVVSPELRKTHRRSAEV